MFAMIRPVRKEESVIADHFTDRSSGRNVRNAGESKFDKIMSSDDADEEAMEAVTKTREILSTLRMQTAGSTGGDDQDCIVMTFRMPLETFVLLMQF